MSERTVRVPRGAWVAAVVALVAAAVVFLVLSSGSGPGDVAIDAASSPAVDPTTPEPTPTDLATGGATADVSATPTVTPEGPEEVRAVWVHLFDDTLKTPAGIDRVVDRVADANATTLVVEVVRRQDAYYDSDVLPRTTDPDVSPGLDVLDRVVSAAHGRGLDVHAWVPALSTYHHVYDDLPRPTDWVWTQHGPDAPVADRWVTRLADGTWSDHLDPGVPAVRDHLAAVMGEIAATYDVDGVHLDYVRYTSEDAGYHPTSLARFHEATGASGTPAVDDPAWDAWRRDQVTALVAEVASAVRAADPTVAVSAAVIAQGEAPTANRPFAATRPVVRYHQDWATWARTGLLDAVFPMVYLDQRTHADWFSDWVGFLDGFAQQVDPLVVGGQAGYLNTPEHSLDQLARLQAATDGVSLYSYQQTADTEPFDVLFDRLPAGPWADPATSPLGR